MLRQYEAKFSPVSSLQENYVSLPVQFKCIHITFSCRIIRLVSMYSAMFNVPSAPESHDAFGSDWTVSPQSEDDVSAD